MKSFDLDLHVPDSTPEFTQQGPQVGADLTVKTLEPVAVRRIRPALWQRINIGKVVLFLLSLYLFVLAIALMKDGARSIAPLLQDGLVIDNTANSLGFGWLFAYAIMSGSPVAAAALTFFDAGTISKMGAFAMITGSRLGACFIVLFIGLLYILRGRDRATSLSMGLLSLIVTATTYLPGMLIGSFILHEGFLDDIQFQSDTLLHSLFDWAIIPISELVVHLLPGWSIFLIGLGLIMLSINFFDKCLPQVTIKESRIGWMSRLIYRPWVMFFLGALVTLISMSVSISLTILVPLSARGFIRRENVIPYIMGANITTFVDTLLAAVLLNNPSAFTIVLVEMVSITMVSILILAFAYRPYLRSTLVFISWITRNARNMIWFMLVILLLPLILMWL